MQIRFEVFSPATATAPPPPPGELHVRPLVLPSGQRAKLTLLALREGPAGFVRGEGAVGVIVLQHEPTLDDLLAALVLEERLAGRELPPDVPLAHYAADLAEGLHPAKGVPPDGLVEGVLEFYRLKFDGPLTDPDRARGFEHDWRKLANVLRPALADPTIDPYRQSLLEGRPEFNAERQHLQHDRKVYERDVRNGDRWLVRLPGESDEVPGLRLWSPRSILFKLWARTDTAAPGGDGYHFLAVNQSGGDWFFSTDPLRRYNIASLAEPLQRAEERRDPARIPPGGKDPNPWYDGRRHGFTIVRPPHGGTRLSDDEVWAVVRRWGQARLAPATRPARAGRRLPLGRAAVWAGVAGAAALLTLSLFARRGPDGAGPQPPEPAPSDPSEVFARSGVTKVERADWEAELRRGQATTRDVALRNTPPEGGPLLLWLEASSARRPPDGIQLRLPARPDVTFGPWGGGEHHWRTPPVREVVPAGAPAATLFVPGQGEDATHDLTLVWRPNPNELHLHVMAVGVSQYDPESGLPRLSCAHKDAIDLTAAFQRLQGPLFTEVHCLPALTDGEATAANVLDRLGQFQKQVRSDPTALKLAVVAFSGHGAIYDRRHFVFLPRDYREGQASRQVYWENMELFLGDLGCPTLLILDTCHSGQAALQLMTRGERGGSDNQALGEGIKEFAAQQPGLFVLAAADRDGKAYEPKAGENGALTLAVLEVLRGQAMPERRGVVSLMDLYAYVSATVPSRARQASREQVVVPGFPPGRRPETIPIAYRQSGGP
jgi:hypothetical protein